MFLKLGTAITVYKCKWLLKADLTQNISEVQWIKSVVFCFKIIVYTLTSFLRGCIIGINIKRPNTHRENAYTAKCPVYRHWGVGCNSEFHLVPCSKKGHLSLSRLNQNKCQIRKIGQLHGLYSLSGKTFYYQISRNLEAWNYGLRVV